MAFKPMQSGLFFLASCELAGGGGGGGGVGANKKI